MVLFEEGKILYFDPFYFKNGNTAKPKYFVVLKNISHKIILASLPTSIDYVPAIQEVSKRPHCIEIPDANFNCYFFPACKIITDCGWCFPENTYIYGHQIDEYDVNILTDIYPTEGIDYEIKGFVSPYIFKELLECFKSSSSVKNKFKRIL